MAKTNFFILLFISCLLSCNKTYDAESCNELSFKSFKGSPKALKELEANCTKIDYKYTKEICQKVLTRFILTGDSKLVMKEYGPQALSCLTENDIEKFGK